jgi:hypothetical protein
MVTVLIFRGFRNRPRFPSGTKRLVADDLSDNWEKLQDQANLKKGEQTAHTGEMAFHEKAGRSPDRA